MTTEKHKGEEPGSEKPEDKLLDRSWLQGKSNEELIDVLFEIILALKARVEESTERITVATTPPAFREDVDLEAEKFMRLPMESEKEPDKEKTWRFVLTSSDPQHKFLALEVYDSIVIGRLAAADVKLDLDLSPYDAMKKGVSRRHALLRPTKASLLLIDLGSTNGTFCNGVKLKPGEPKSLEDSDTISLAGLHFKLKIVRQPEKKLALPIKKAEPPPGQ